MAVTVPSSGKKNPPARNQCEQVVADGGDTSVHSRSTRRHIPEDGILLIFLGFNK
jgi:hypothetical protein